MSLKEIFLSGIQKDQKSSASSAGGSILRQASRRITDKTNRDSAVINNTDSSVSQSRSTLAKPTIGEQTGSQNQTIASSVSTIFYSLNIHQEIF
jgi:hypothetical protein